MSKIDNGGNAFPVASIQIGKLADGDTLSSLGPNGMTLRDYFAAQALTGLCAHMTPSRFKDIIHGIQAGGNEAKVAYLMADAMIYAKTYREEK